MKKYIIPFLLTFMLILIPKDTFAQSVTPTNFLIKNSNNTAILYQSSNRDFFTSTPYFSGKFEINLGNTYVEYNHSYGLDFYLTMYVSRFNDYGNFGYGNPELYINNNGLHQTSLTISAFTNTLGSCSNVVCPYQLHLSFTFATQYEGTLYVALPYDIPFDTYGWTLNTMELTNYGQNTSNSDIIANNNQNTQNIISNNNQNTQNIINSQNQINNSINDDDTTGASNDAIDFFDSFLDRGSTEPGNIISLPLAFVSQLNQTCQPINLSFPYFGSFTIPCVQTYVSQFLPTALIDLIKLIVNGILLYKILLSMVDFIQKLKDPNDAELEVIDL